jgi:hypothetical protein
MYTDIFLSFSDEAAARAVLYRAEGDDLTPNFANIDTIGVIYKDEQPITGWHVNVRLVDGEDGSTLAPFAVTPTTPLRIWG